MFQKQPKLFSLERTGSYRVNSNVEMFFVCLLITGLIVNLQIRIKIREKLRQYLKISMKSECMMGFCIYSQDITTG